MYIKNIGKLPDANLRIGQFTVFAGPNNTGKSFVSKILYSLFDAMNANHPQVHLHNLTAPVRESLENLDIWDNHSAAHETAETPESPINTLGKKIHEMEDLVAQRSWDNYDELLPVINTLNGMTQEFPKFLLEIHKSLTQQEKSLSQQWKESHFANLEESLKSLQDRLAEMKPHDFMQGGIELMLDRNFTANFQTQSIFALRDKKEREAKISIPGIVDLDWVDQDWKFAITHEGVQFSQAYSKVLYLESPMYWKLKNALESFRLSDRNRRIRRKRLTGVPEYFYDLASELRSEYTGEMDFPELHSKLTGKNVLDGKLVISDTGEILFREKDRSFPLTLTATGVINLGILALLIERKILNKDSFVFIDEPEAHLHPEWQVAMAETLFDLAKGGGHVVVATHSADILKWLEVHIKKHPEDAGLVALNKFPADAAIFDEESFDDKMASIKQELTRPFADLYMEGL